MSEVVKGSMPSVHAEMEVSGRNPTKRFERVDVSLISVSELATELEERRGGLRLLDVRWSLQAPDGREAYERGHIRSAVYVDLETELSDHSVSCRRT
ncbi:hypothetical protein BFL43_16180 [Williamsia sp. 1135]|nr:hypothetical protein BFL43_16180 [Williamsia sp. 1135]